MIDAFQLRAQATRSRSATIGVAIGADGTNPAPATSFMPRQSIDGQARRPQLAERNRRRDGGRGARHRHPLALRPCLCVTRDERWGRSYESFGEDPALVESMETMIQDLQGAANGKDLKHNDKVLATAKHFVGDGGTEYGSSTTGSYTIDQGVTKVTRSSWRPSTWRRTGRRSTVASARSCRPTPPRHPR